MLRIFATAAAIAALAISSGTVIAQQAPPGPRQMTLPNPVNLKVLPKNTSPQDLMKIMQGFNHALGVNCNFCHVMNLQTHRPDFASDQKPDKNTARTMITMTNEINEKYLSQIHDPDAAPDQKTVSCSTCHRGHSMPMPFTASSEHEGHEHAPAQP